MSARQLLTVLILTFLTVTPVLAKDIPEFSGDYPDPDRPDLRVRVFAHDFKPNKLPVTTSLPVCTDPNSQAVTGATGWHLPSQVTYVLNPSGAPANLATIAQAAFATWATPLTGKVTFSKGPNTSINRSKADNQNVIAWGQVSGSNTLAVTYTRYYPSTRVAVDTDTIFNKRVSWGWSNTCGANYYDVQDILTHELGHWTGLDDEYTADFVNNTMYGYASMGEVSKNTLTSGDLSGLSAIYH